MGQDILLVGLIVLLALVSGTTFTRFKLPPLIAFLILGFLVRMLSDRTALLQADGVRALELLGMVGVTVLLFQVGLKSNIRALLGQLRRASPIWLGNIVASGVLAYCSAAWLLGFDPLTSAVIAIALTVTSVGVSAEVWNRCGMLNTPAGELFVDVAELDDISGVVAAATLISVMASISNGGEWSVAAVSATAFIVLAKLAGFIALIYGFAHWIEPHLTRFFEKIGRPPHPMLLIAATGLVMAGSADILGLSIAVGAFFAGLAYSRDPNAVREEKDFDVIYALFVPFFFIHVGMQVTPEAFQEALLPGVVLLVVAIVGKLAGNLGAGILVADRSTAMLLTVSMIPRAEIALLVTQQANAMGYVSNTVLSAIVFVSALTCLIAPWVLQSLLRMQLAK